MKKHLHKIAWVEPGSIAEELGLEPGDAIEEINGNEIEDIFDYQYYVEDEYLDVLIPRGGAGLIQNVVKNATIPVIQTGTGNCHVYVDASADQNMALDIIFNAKTQRIGVCNACESLLVHRSIAKEFLPLLRKKLEELGYEEALSEDF